MKRSLIVLSLLLVAVPSFAERRRVATTTTVPLFPACASVDGTPAVTFSRDRGATLAPVTQKLEGIGYSYGLAVLTDDILLATHKQTLSLSTDGGCTWRAVGTLEGEQFYRITTGADGRNYIWDDNRNDLARYDFLSATLTKLKPPVSIIGLGTDPGDGRHVLIGGNDGTVWESRDAGATWTLRGSLPRQTFPIYYRFAFDPNDVNHIVAGVANNGAYYTGDGGVTWFQSSVLGSTETNIFSIVISPANRGIVWAMGINLLESDANVPSHGRHIYLSYDNGASFFPVIDESAAVQLVNQPVMAADPRNENVVYFIFGTYFQGYGTDIYRYDAAARAIQTFHNDYDDINAIAFSESHDGVMYFGLETEKRTAP
jgi:hypothetical protein